ncbi:hypothetical protein PHYSODRAFT_260309 [Phytophthora sojae]|uniref:Uncharacterized protein n=1 Tax=Phytophthora sojae (strain P6497) TaxID=1094619 RepID=G4YWX7_PHYSP|nr:hypothetical protein PHYSODRAFT_260309 [Phytophthora sojae]EGZ24475.1 hypothetical protein PHYSODRAFT_260309 [Phytophthora sojae]|eukprot:XP_009519763.1 hypothetical protein PHYSODRAFT_260309 [Phytophthora sojae]
MAGSSLFKVDDDVEFWRVLIHLSVLALCLLVFERVLHRFEHHLTRHDKYRHMLRKVQRAHDPGLDQPHPQVIKEVTTVDGYSKTMTAFQVADLIIFVLAIALVLQAVCIFLQLRNHSRRTDRVELISTQDLVNKLRSTQQGGDSTAWLCSARISHKVGYKVDYELAKVFMVLAWLLFVLHMVALGYFRSKGLRNFFRTEPDAVQDVEPRVHFRLSPKIWHAMVIFLMVLNGFYVALFLQCALHDLDEIYDELGWVAAVIVPLLITLNVLVLQQQIFRDYMLSADVSKLHAVLESFGYRLSRFRFNSVVQLLFELQGAEVEYRQLIQLLTLVQASQDESERFGGGGYPLIQQSSMPFGDDRIHDGARPNFTRAFSSTRHIALLTELYPNTTIAPNSSMAGSLLPLRRLELRRSGVHHLDASLQHLVHPCPSLPSHHTSFQRSPLQQSSSVSDFGQCDFAYAKATTPRQQHKMPTINDSPNNQRCDQRPMLQRRQFTRSSSRMLHGMFNIRHLSQSIEESADSEPIV